MFSLSDEQWKKLHEWHSQILEEVATGQWENLDIRQHMIDSKTPYGGAVGGALTYMFTPTNLGTVVKVEDGFTGEKIDLTDYEDW